MKSNQINKNHQSFLKNAMRKLKIRAKNKILRMIKFNNIFQFNLKTKTHKYLAIELRT